MKVIKTIASAAAVATQLAQFAMDALLEEVRLSPKPGLVDSHNNGTHHDLSLELMEQSARALGECFYEIALASYQQEPSAQLRERLAAIGRFGEQQMLIATGQVNTHKGAIWALGLITGAASLLISRDHDALHAEKILSAAGAIALFNDRYVPAQFTHGTAVRKRYQVRSAREEAASGFPSLVETALPAWRAYAHEHEDIRRLNTLLALMAQVDDTCILHRSDMQVLREVQQQAAAILAQGGLGKADNWNDYMLLDQYITTNWVSPGGSADLLAATIFIEKITQHFKIN
jgi:triphosphoribosyl-dephospho-CoA synthase